MIDPPLSEQLIPLALGSSRTQQEGLKAIDPPFPWTHPADFEVLQPKFPVEIREMSKIGYPGFIDHDVR
ncbi:unnamed protein product, partial [Aphanomyces euteiches]